METMLYLCAGLKNIVIILQTVLNYWIILNLFFILGTIIMASLDLDPTFARALRLMHSKSKDSEDQLRAMLDEAIKQRHGGNKTLANIFIKKVNSYKKVKSVCALGLII